MIAYTHVRALEDWYDEEGLSLLAGEVYQIDYIDYDERLCWLIGVDYVTGLFASTIIDMDDEFGYEFLVLEDDVNMP